MTSADWPIVSPVDSSVSAGGLGSRSLSRTPENARAFSMAVLALLARTKASMTGSL